MSMSMMIWPFIGRHHLKVSHIWEWEHNQNFSSFFNYCGRLYWNYLMHFNSNYYSHIQCCFDIMPTLGLIFWHYGGGIMVREVIQACGICELINIIHINVALASFIFGFGWISSSASSDSSSQFCSEEWVPFTIPRMSVSLMSVSACRFAPRNSSADMAQCSLCECGSHSRNPITFVTYVCSMLYFDSVYLNSWVYIKYKSKGWHFKLIYCLY